MAEYPDLPEAPPLPPAAPAGKVPPDFTSKSFWAEFVRVQSDKFLLFALIVVLHRWGAADLAKVAVGGLIVLIQGQRFKF